MPKFAMALGATAALLAFGVGSSAVAAEDSVSVKVSDLDFSKARDQTWFQYRVREAVDSVCGSPTDLLGGYAPGKAANCRAELTAEFQQKAEAYQRVSSQQGYGRSN